MAHYQVILAYDGTLFKGFQRQAHARTVQGVFEQTLRQLGWQGRAVLSAGRTDTGVHASGQVVAFELDWHHSPEELRSALNANLPEDVSGREVLLTSPDFHPRYQALARRYRYRLYCQDVRDPLRERYAWRVWSTMEPSLLQAAAQALLGSHDFAAFGSPTGAGGSTTRKILSAGWISSADEYIFEVLGNAFLYRMVRRMVYLQVLVGQGKLDLEAFIQGVTRQTSLTPGLAPPNGLTLVEVEYPLQAVNDNQQNLAQGSLRTLAASGEDDRGQNIRP